MQKISISRIAFFILKLILIIAICFVIFISISLVSTRLLIDKKPKSNIDEGKYILNKIADAYEKFLREREQNLEKERLILLEKQDQSLTEIEKREIELKLREIEKEKRKLDNEFEKTIEERKNIEESLKNLEKNLVSSNEEIARLNKKYLNLTVEKESMEEYWKNYVEALKEAIRESYKFKPKKLAEIDDGFADNNGKNFIINAFKEFYSIVNEKDTRVEDVTKQKDNEIQNIINEKDLIIKEKDKEIDKISNDINSMIDENKKLKDLLDKSEISSDFYINFYKEYSNIIEKFDSLTKHYKNAESLYNNKDYDRAGKEYLSVLNEFNEINDSYLKIIEIQKASQNIRGKELYDDAMKNLSNKKYDDAYNTLITLLKEAPASDYTPKALDSLINISNNISNADKIEIENKNAKILIDEGDKLFKNQEYNQAISSYNKAILNYPNSSYTDIALTKTNQIYELINNQSKEIYMKELKEKFQADYDNYVKYQKRGDIEKARKYYFNALQKAFDLYTNNSISEFKEFEDKYIETLIKLNEREWKRRYNILTD